MRNAAQKSQRDPRASMSAEISASVAALAEGDIFALGRRLQDAGRVYAETETRLKGDSSPVADRECAEAWQRCEEIVEEIAACPARGLSGLQIKARAVAWTASETKDELLKGMVEDLLALEDDAHV